MVLESLGRAAGKEGAGPVGLLNTPGKPERRFSIKLGLPWAILKNAENPASGDVAALACKADAAACWMAWSSAVKVRAAIVAS